MTHDPERRDPEPETPPPPELKRRVIRSLRRRGVLRPAPVWRVAGRVAAALALFGAGALVGRELVPAAPPSAPAGTQTGVPADGRTGAPAGAETGVPAGALPRFLLVLQEPAGFQPAREPAELVREYGDWAMALRDRGRLVVADRLEAWSEILPGGVGGAAPAEMDPPPPQITGFFLVRAEDREDALALARTHPHLGHGGRVVVMEVGGG